jgi:hypothetical protein
MDLWHSSLSSYTIPRTLQRVHPLPSVDYLRSRLRYDPATGHLTWRNGPFAGRRAGWVSPDGYEIVHIDGVRLRSHRAIWAIVYGAWPALEIDHISRDRLDNRIVNLRLADRSTGNSNRGVYNREGFLGVYEKSGRYLARTIIANHGARVGIGSFGTAEEAARAFDEHALRTVGPRARTNVGEGLLPALEGALDARTRAIASVVERMTKSFQELQTLLQSPAYVDGKSGRPGSKLMR